MVGPCVMVMAQKISEARQNIVLRVLGVQSYGRIPAIRDRGFRIQRNVDVEATILYMYVIQYQNQGSRKLPKHDKAMIADLCIVTSLVTFSRGKYTTWWGQIIRQNVEVEATKTKSCGGWSDQNHPTSNQMVFFSYNCLNCPRPTFVTGIHTSICKLDGWLYMYMYRTTERDESVKPIWLYIWLSHTVDLAYAHTVWSSHWTKIEREDHITTFLTCTIRIPWVTLHQNMVSFTQKTR